MTVNILFESIVSTYPNCTAVVAGQETINYADLNETSNHIAYMLRSQGVQPGAAVVLVVDRSVYAIVGMLGIIKAGAYYVPIEWNGKDADIEQRLKEIDGSVILTISRFSGIIPSHDTKMLVIDAELPRLAETLPEPGTSESDLLYVMFTSGSSGLSKGVEITHANVLHYSLSLMRHLSIEKPLGYAFVSSFSADLGNTSIYLSLLSGGCLHLIDEHTRRDPQRFQSYLVHNNVDVLKITPSHFGGLFGNLFYCDQISLKFLIFGGEQLQIEMVESVFKSKIAQTIVNHYGPTEATVGVSFYVMNSAAQVLPSAKTVPIGWPIGKTEIQLLDSEGQCVEIEGSGELFISGPSVARGYYNNEKLTAERFILMNLDGQGMRRYYRTGDLCRRHENGCLEFLGRLDRQVKVRGFRVDPNLIENVILDIPGVSATVVLVAKSGSGHMLAAVVVSNRDKYVDIAISEEYLFGHLRKMLLDYMIPSRLMIVDALPMNANGKIDLQRLRREIFPSKNPEFLAATSFGLEEDCSATERVIIDVWRRYLDIPYIGRRDNFFALGGDSIIAIQVISALQSQGFEVSSKIFLENPTVRGLAESLLSRSQRVPQQESIRKEVSKVLAPIQQWFFEQEFADPDHWCQAILIESRTPINPEPMAIAVTQLLDAHPMLHTAFRRMGSKWVAEDKMIDSSTLVSFTNLSTHLENERQDTINKVSAELYQSIQLADGVVAKFHLFKDGDIAPDKLLIICHHLVIDGVSWRILVDDLARVYSAAFKGEQYFLPQDESSYWRWSKALERYTKTPEFKSESAYWEKIERSSQEFLVNDFTLGPNDEASTRVVWFDFDELHTYNLQREATIAANAPLQNLLLAAFVFEIKRFSNIYNLVVDIENHGREAVSGDVDVARTIGWFTALFPLPLNLTECLDISTTLASIRDAMTKVPSHGVGFGARMYYYETNRSQPYKSLSPELCFNYLGQFSFSNDSDTAWFPGRDYIGPTRGARNQSLYKIKLTARIVHKRLVCDLSYSGNHYRKETIEAIAAGIKSSLLRLVERPTVFKTRAETVGTILSDERPSSGLLTYCPCELSVRNVKLGQKLPNAIFLTGATGFVGIYILRQLLQETNAEISCLVRTDDSNQAYSRLLEQFKWYFPDENLTRFKSRVRVYAGNITQANLGLPLSEYAQLSRMIDMVFHCAADIRLFGVYEELQKTNVGGTRNVVQLVESFRKKELHYLSTLSVAGRSVSGEIKSFSENDSDYGQEFLNYYEQTKLQGEKLVRQYVAAGGHAYIYRMGSISAPAKAGRFQRNLETNRVMHSLRGYILSKRAPDLPNEPLLLSQVDIVAQGVVAIALNEDIEGGTFHTVSQTALNHNELIENLVRLGFEIHLVKPEDYIKSLSDFASKFGEEVALAMIWAKRNPRNVVYNCQRTQKILASHGICFPQTDSVWLAKLIQHCYQIGFIKPQGSNLNPSTAFDSFLEMI